MPRHVRVVLCTSAGGVLGELPELVVEPQWWPEVAPVVSAVRSTFGAEISVLRLLDVDCPSADMGGSVSYLAELPSDAVPGNLLPTPYADDPAVTAEHPLRATWARPGGVAATVEWADGVLTGLGRPRTSRAVQQKSWNLSSIVRLSTSEGEVWCKSVPPFFAHEGTVMTMIAVSQPELVPAVLGVDRPSGTTLIADVPGEDQWDAPVQRLVEMVHHLVRLQVAWVDRTAELIAIGAWDWRATGLSRLVEALMARPEVRVALTERELQAADALTAEVPALLGDLRECGLPETLVHGDFHPGNWRFGSTGLRLLDWGDSGVGHPMLDFAAFLPRLSATDRPVVRAAWVDAWRAQRPGSDPARAARLIDPLAAFRQAILYQRFLDAIEPSERCYHADDPVIWVRHAIKAARTVDGVGRR